MVWVTVLPPDLVAEPVGVAQPVAVSAVLHWTLYPVAPVTAVQSARSFAPSTVSLTPVVLGTLSSSLTMMVLVDVGANITFITGVSTVMAVREMLRESGVVWSVASSTAVRVTLPVVDPAAMDMVAPLRV